MEQKKIDKKNIKYEYEDGLTQDKEREKLMEFRLNQMLSSVSPLINQQDGYIQAYFTKDKQSISFEGMASDLQFTLESHLKPWHDSRSPSYV